MTNRTDHRAVDPAVDAIFDDTLRRWREYRREHPLRNPPPDDGHRADRATALSFFAVNMDLSDRHMPAEEQPLDRILESAKRMWGEWRQGHPYRHTGNVEDDDYAEHERIEEQVIPTEKGELLALAEDPRIFDVVTIYGGEQTVAGMIRQMVIEATYEVTTIPEREAHKDEPYV